MNYANKRAFTLVESLVAISLFSFILMFYVPAYYQEAHRIQKQHMETTKLRIFYEMVQIELKTSLAHYPNDLSNFPITYFDCQPNKCQILFDDGSEYFVELFQKGVN
ncbi:type II secretion system protein [Fundicoccus culcitae]|uniref:Type II secretion system GspH family protein n=1 Tax=Fundicoccus culcitae TaxID=2969821 RepID=A0ABY5P748_9LACT|nr:type II secretion system protein [Fundicoccus culcitae]UUX34228.1 type II secretion system GspH family protein [Fundicoccus culcitae]